MIPRSEIAAIDIADELGRHPRASAPDAALAAAGVRRQLQQPDRHPAHEARRAGTGARHTQPRAADGTRRGARALLRARGHHADAAAGAIPAHAPALGLRGHRIRRYRRTGHARGHPRGDRRRIHHRSDRGHAQGCEPRPAGQLAGQCQRDHPRTQPHAGLAAAGGGTAHAQRPAARETRDHSRRRARRCASATTTSRSCRSPTTRSARCACAWCRRLRRRRRARRPAPRRCSRPRAASGRRWPRAADSRAAGSRA